MDNEIVIDPRHVRRFRRLADDMAKLLAEIAEYCPEVNLYLANDSWHLLTGPSHDPSYSTEKARQDRIVETVLVMRSGGGDW